MATSKELRYQPARELRVENNADGSKSISGAIFYNQPSEDLGGFIEILAPGCFKDSINGDVLCLRQHDANLLMGRTKSKTLKLTDDNVALRFVCKLPQSTSGDDLAIAIDRGDLDSTSFGFQTIADDWIVDTDGNVTRILREVNLLEVSPCVFPAYPGNTVSVRSCPIGLRSKLKPAKRSNDEGCDCDCEYCEDDDCGNCDDDSCSDAQCAENGCPNQDDEDRSLVSKSEVRKMHMRLELARRK